MKILDSLYETEKTLKLDVDLGHFPEWHRLMVILRFCSLFPKHRITQTGTGSYHLETNVTPSSMRLRRMLRDCKGRLYVSERRFEMIGSWGDIIFWTGKMKFKFKYVKNKVFIQRIRKRVSDREINLKDILCLPFNSQIDFHRKRRLKWWKRRKGELKEVKKWMNLKNWKKYTVKH